MSASEPKRVALEDFVPYDRSVRWRLHNAYYAACGSAAWRDGAIPFYASSNYGIARQHAELFVAHVAELERAGALGPREKIWVLEVGAGSGAFAEAFLRALSVVCGAAGQRILKRLRYLLSDYSEQTVREAAASPELVPHVAERRVVPAIYDLLRPAMLMDVERRAISPSLTAVFANYVCCVAPLKILRKIEDGPEEQFVRCSVECSDGAKASAAFDALVANPTEPELMKALRVETEWRPVELETLFADRLHVKVVRAVWQDFAVASMPYPYTFIEMVRALRGRLVDGGLILVNDYGNAGTDDLRLRDRRIPQHYGNAINHGVEFVLFDALAPVLGLAHERTHDTLRAVHTAALWKGRVPRALRDTFRRTHVLRSDGEDLLDFSNAARRLFRDGVYETAARLYERCLAIDPDSLDLLYRAGEACLETEAYERALTLLERGLERDTRHAFDFPLLVGRVRMKLGDHDGALAALAASAQRAPQAQTYVLLGRTYALMGNASSARVAYEAARAIDPGHEEAAKAIAALDSGTR